MGRSCFIPDFHVSPEQTKTHESSHFIKEFHVFWFISDIYKMGAGSAAAPLRLLVSFCAVTARPPAYQIRGFAQERGRRSPWHFTTEK